MNSLKRLLLIIASMELAGPALAVVQTGDPNTLSLAVARQADAIVASSAGISNVSMSALELPTQANYRMASVVTVKYTPAEAVARSTRAVNSGARQYSGASAAGVKPERDWPANGTRIDLLAVANAGVAAPQTVRADAAPRGFRFPVVAMPEPTEWMQLLCGLVVAGFIARRRTNVGVG